MIQPTHSSRRILLPARPWFVYLSLCIAALLNLIQWGRVLVVPDLLALTLVFWGIHQPRLAGMGSALLLGLLMDVANGSLMGQHALAYVLLAFTANSLSRRILWFSMKEQAMHVLPMLLGGQLVMLLIGLASGADFPGLEYFLSSVFATLLWFPLTYVLLLPQYQPLERDENRPI